MATPDEFAALVVQVADWLEHVADQLERLMPPLRDARASSEDFGREGFARAENARCRALAALREPIDTGVPRDVPPEVPPA